MATRDASLRGLNRASDSLRKGMPLVVFPEGGRSASGQLREFMGGAFYMAIKAQAPVVPIVLVGTYELLPMNSFHLRCLAGGDDRRRTDPDQGHGPARDGQARGARARGDGGNV